jgi:predicted small lipoprotein YifL
MQFSLLRFIFLLCTMLALSGCGKKGVLYLPDKSGNVTSTSASSAQPTQPVQK